jgi:hypothetical protein
MAVLALAAGPAVVAAVYVIPRVAWDTARVLWAALPTAAVVVACLLVTILGEDVSLLLPKHGVPSLLVGKAARGEASPAPREVQAPAAGETGNRETDAAPPRPEGP